LIESFKSIIETLECKREILWVWETF
jgi:hypothetical protein